MYEHAVLNSLTELEYFQKKTGHVSKFDHKNVSQASLHHFRAIHFERTKKEAGSKEFKKSNVKLQKNQSGQWNTAGICEF